MRSAGAGYRVDDIPDDPQALIRRLAAGPTNADPGAAAEETFSFAEYSTFFATLPLVGAAGRHRPLGAGRARPLFPRGAARLRPVRDPRLPRRQCRGAGPAGARLRPRSESELSRPGTAAAARLSRRLCLAGAGFPRRRGHSSGQARHPRMAAGQGAWRCRPNACPRRCCRPCRISTRSSSTTPARGPRPSAAPRR